jgi:acyl-CoA synthetase (AMP-forming)/AMP-acid ligase II
MPLFHIHGLIAGVLRRCRRRRAGVLHAGLQRAQVLRLDGRGTAHLVHGGADDAPDDPGARSKQHAIIAANPLRFIRSSSSSMPPQVIRELESTFGAPLIESYGMTEAGPPDGSPTRCRPGAQARLGRPAGRPESRSWTRPACCRRRDRRRS